MNPDFLPLGLIQPEVVNRRREAPRNAPPPQEIIARRQEIARRLKEQVIPLSSQLREMSDEERKAVFFKLEHEGAVSLRGTDLKPISEPSDQFTLAVPRSDNLDKLVNKIDDFETGALRAGHAPNERLAGRLNSIRRGDPKDRLSQALFEIYEELTKQDWVVCEIEMLSLAQGQCA